MLMLLIALHGEDFVAALLDGEVVRFGRLQDLAELVREGVAIRKRFEKGAGGGVLRGGPLFHRRIVEVFQPAVIVGDSDLAVGIGDRLLGGLRQQGGDGESQNDSNSEHAVKYIKVGRTSRSAGMGLRPTNSDENPCGARFSVPLSASA